MKFVVAIDSFKIFHALWQNETPVQCGNCAGVFVKCNCADIKITE